MTRKNTFFQDLPIILCTAILFVLVVWSGDEGLASSKNNPSQNAEKLRADRHEIALAVQSIKNLIPLDVGAFYALRRQLVHFQKLLDQKSASAGSHPTDSYATIKQQITHIQDSLPEIQDKANSVHPVGITKRQFKEIAHELSNFMVTIHNDLLLTLLYEEALRRQSQPILIAIQPDRGEGADYYDKESISFEINAYENCFIKVVSFGRIVGEQKSNTFSPIVVFPNEKHPNNRLLAGGQIVFGQQGEVTIEPPFGRDVVMVVASENQFSDAVPLSESLWEEVGLDTKKLLRSLYGRNAEEITVDFDASFFVSHSMRNIPPQTTQDKGAVFLSAYEAEGLRLGEQEWIRVPDRVRAISTGPIINILYPSVTEKDNPMIKTTTPMDLVISFEKKYASVDMESLEVIAQKGFFSKSLTDRMKPYIQGTQLTAKNLEIPSGKFRIQITIADQDGMQTSQEYRLMVSEK